MNVGGPLRAGRAAATRVEVLGTVLADHVRENRAAADFAGRVSALAELASGAAGGLVLSQLERLVANRIALDALLAADPRIRSTLIDRPVFVTGLPRSGTTHLYRLLASDARWRSLPLWEALYPFASGMASGRGVATDVRARRRLAAAGLARTGLVHADTMAQHEFGIDLPEEDSHLTALEDPTTEFFLSPFLTEERLLNRDYVIRTEHHAFLRVALQALEHPLGSVRWLLKNPVHMASLDSLGESFPDRTVVLIHRAPLDVVVSAARLLAHILSRRARSASQPAEPVDFAPLAGPAILRMCSQTVRTFLDSSAATTREGFVEVSFDQLITDPLAIVDAVYSASGMEFGPVVPTVRAYANSHSRHRLGRVLDDISAYGVTEARVRREFADYYDYLRDRRIAVEFDT